jgi:hypothetical protein
MGGAPGRARTCGPELRRSAGPAVVPSVSRESRVSLANRQPDELAEGPPFIVKGAWNIRCLRSLSLDNRVCGIALSEAT